MSEPRQPISSRRNKMIASDYAALSFIIIGIGYAITFRRLEWLNMNPSGLLTTLVQLPFGNLFLTMFLLCAGVTLMIPFGAAQGYMSLTSNTLYQNLNYSQMNLFVSGNSIQGWEGANSMTMAYISNGNSIVDIPYGYYYKFNFTTGNFMILSSE